MGVPEDIAEDLIRQRWKEIQGELKLLEVPVRPEDVFQVPKADEGRVKNRSTRDPRVRIVVISNAPNLLNGTVVLDISETYSYDAIRTDSSAPLKLLDYSYQFSYMPELVIEAAWLPQPAKSYWGDLLLTQRRLLRFDGEAPDSWSGHGQDYRNSHYVNHFHADAAAPIRFPVPGRPSVLSVACFALFCFEYDRWLRLARSEREVLSATQVVLPHVLA